MGRCQARVAVIRLEFNCLPFLPLLPLLRYILNSYTVCVLSLTDMSSPRRLHFFKYNRSACFRPRLQSSGLSSPVCRHAKMVSHPPFGLGENLY